MVFEQWHAFQLTLFQEFGMTCLVSGSLFLSGFITTYRYRSASTSRKVILTGAVIDFLTWIATSTIFLILMLLGRRLHVAIGSLIIIGWSVFVLFPLCIYLERSFGIDRHYRERLSKLKNCRTAFMIYRKQLLFVLDGSQQAAGKE